MLAETVPALQMTIAAVGAGAALAGSALGAGATLLAQHLDRKHKRICEDETFYLEEAINLIIRMKDRINTMRDAFATNGREAGELHLKILTEKSLSDIALRIDVYFPELHNKFNKMIDIDEEAGLLLQRISGRRCHLESVMPIAFPF